MGLALDEPDDADETLHADGFDFIVRGRELEELSQFPRGIRIHFRPNRWIGSEFLVTLR